MALLPSRTQGVQAAVPANCRRRGGLCAPPCCTCTCIVSGDGGSKTTKQTKPIQGWSRVSGVIMLLCYVIILLCFYVMLCYVIMLLCYVNVMLCDYNVLCYFIMLCYYVIF